jgi:DNA replication protein DnaC
MFSKWGEVFSDPVIANALLDRLIHHSHIIKIKGASYRIKDKIDMSETTDVNGKS